MYENIISRAFDFTPDHKIRIYFVVGKSYSFPAETLISNMVL